MSALTQFKWDIHTVYVVGFSKKSNIFKNNEVTIFAILTEVKRFTSKLRLRTLYFAEECKNVKVFGPICTGALSREH